VEVAVQEMLVLIEEALAVVVVQ
jgi:hypothetical protein